MATIHEWPETDDPVTATGGEVRTQGWQPASGSDAIEWREWVYWPTPTEHIQPMASCVTIQYRCRCGASHDQATRFAMPAGSDEEWEQAKAADAREQQDAQAWYHAHREH